MEHFVRLSGWADHEDKEGLHLTQTSDALVCILDSLLRQTGLASSLVLFLPKQKLGLLVCDSLSSALQQPQNAQNEFGRFFLKQVNTVHNI